MNPIPLTAPKTAEHHQQLRQIDGLLRHLQAEETGLGGIFRRHLAVLALDEGTKGGGLARLGGLKGWICFMLKDLNLN